LAESNAELANSINHLAVRNIAMIAKEEKCKLIHISTDYVFDGTTNRPYKETAEPNPQSVYGCSKLAGEKAIININPENAIIIRTSWVYSSFGHNFVKTMLKISKERTEIKVVSDQLGSPTYARDLAYIILELIQHIKNKQVEIYHYTNNGICSWFEFAQAIFKIKNINCKVDPITTNNYPTPAKRPIYSVLDKGKIKNTFQLTIPHWEDSLKEMLTQREI
jgi:dTDP-4-dehydrorhamnose reductase